MVTILEQQEAIKEAEAQTLQQQQDIEFARAGFLRETEPKAQTIQRQLELERTFGKGSVGLLLSEQRKAKARARREALPLFGKAEEQLIGFREEIGLAKTEIADIERRNLVIRKQNEAIAKRNQDRATALKIFRRGGRVSGESAFVRNIVLRLQQGQEIQREQLKEQVGGGIVVPPFVTIQGQVFPTIPPGEQLLFLQPGETPQQRLASLGLELSTTPLQFEAPVSFEQQVPFVEKSLVSDIKTKFSDVAGDIREFAFGETGRQFGKQFIGIGIPTTPLFISVAEISKVAREGERVSEFLAPLTMPTIPSLFDVSREVRKEAIKFGVQTGGFALREIETPGGLAITGAFTGALFVAPPIVTLPLLTFATISGGKTALDPELTPPERALGGLVAVGGGLGVASIGLPFLRGRIGFGKQVKTAREGFEFIDVGKELDIGLIQPGGARTGIDLPKISPLRRGGFGVKASEKQFFLGKDQLLATSQRGLFKVGKDIPLETEFFVTPQDPIVKIPVSRISRLGLIEPFKFPKQIELGFGLPKTPQIGIVRGAVARRGRPGVFELGRGSELEAILKTGTITDVLKVGRTRIKGQAVDIFEFKIGKPDKFTIGKDIGKIDRTAFGTSKTTTRISSESLLTSLFRSSRSLRTGIKSSLSLGTTSLISPTISSLVSPPSRRISPRTLPSITPTAPTISPPIISPPTISIISPTRRSLTRRPPSKRLPRRFRLKEKEKVKKKGKKRRTPIRPSFTSIVAELRGGIPKITFVGKTEVGILPTRLRRLPGRSKSKKKGKRKNQFDFGLTNL